MQKFLMVLMAATVFQFVGNELSADVVPIWTTPDNLEVDVPFGGSTTFSASGNVNGFFDVILAFDTSGSMADNTGQTAPNGGSARLDWAQSGAIALTNGLDDRIRMGVVDFDVDAFLAGPVAPLGPVDANPSHRTELINVINSFTGQGNTNITNAIEFSANELAGAGSDSQHIVFLTDGMPTGGDTEAAVLQAVEAAFDIGVDSVNTIGLPGADLDFIEQMANVGNGVFVDGTNLDDLIDNFASILNGVEVLEQLDIILPDGSILSNVGTTLDGDFTISGEVFAGCNTFLARATSNLGNVTFAQLNVTGISAIPEPSMALVLIGLAMTGFCRRRNAAV